MIDLQKLKEAVADLIIPVEPYWTKNHPKKVILDASPELIDWIELAVHLLRNYDAVAHGPELSKEDCAVCCLLANVTGIPSGPRKISVPRIRVAAEDVRAEHGESLRRMSDEMNEELRRETGPSFEAAIKKASEQIAEAWRKQLAELGLPIDPKGGE